MTSCARLMPPQATEMSCYPVAQEITWVCADFLVELRGFEPLTSSAQPPARLTGSLPFLGGSSATSTHSLSRL
jgi:hypothetical protein